MRPLFPRRRVEKRQMWLTEEKIKRSHEQWLEAQRLAKNPPFEVKPAPRLQRAGDGDPNAIRVAGQGRPPSGKQATQEAPPHLRWGPGPGAPGVRKDGATAALVGVSTGHGRTQAEGESRGSGPRTGLGPATRHTSDAVRAGPCQSDEGTTGSSDVHDEE